MIRVLDYNPSWRDDFAAEAKRVGAALSGVLVRIHHIGSTAIPGTKAKPIIDILLEVTSLGAPHVLRHLAFRDYMLAHPPIARDYGELKERLAAAHPSDEVAYADGKDAFVKDHQSRALSWTSEHAS